MYSAVPATPAGDGLDLLEEHHEHVVDDCRLPMHGNTQQPSIGDSIDPDNQDYTNQSEIWSSGVWRRFPLLPFLSLLAVLACLVTSICILEVSDGKPVNNWGGGVSPAVYLAIISVLTNVLLSFALANGLVASYWITALRGCTLTQLRNNWESGNSVWGAVTTAFSSGSKVTALACLCTAIGLLRGPFNQRASSVQPNVLYEVQGLLQLNIAKKLPVGYTGINTASRTRIIETARLTPVFRSIMQDYSRHADIYIEHVACAESCNLVVKGFGFHASCQTTDHQSENNASFAYSEDLFTTSAKLYNIDSDHDDDTMLNQWPNTGLRLDATYYLRSQFVNDDTIEFQFRSHSCNLTGGTTNYKLKVNNGIVASIDHLSSESFQRIELQSPVNAGGQSTVGGFQYAMSYLYDSSSTFDFHGAVSSVVLKGSLANDMIDDDSGSIYNQTYKDPMDTMLKGLHEIAFRASLRAGEENATDTNAQQNVSFTGYESRTIYVTNRVYMLLAATVNLVSLVAVAATFYGWWELGRKFSLDPLEIAKAFDSPLLRQVGSNLPTQRMDRTQLAVKVRYGEVSKIKYTHGRFEAQERGEPVLSLHAEAEKPQDGVRYGF